MWSSCAEHGRPEAGAQGRAAAASSVPRGPAQSFSSLIELEREGSAYSGRRMGASGKQPFALAFGEQGSPLSALS